MQGFHRHAEQVGRFAALLDEAPPARPAPDALVGALLDALRLGAGRSDAAGRVPARPRLAVTDIRPH